MSSGGGMGLSVGGAGENAGDVGLSNAHISTQGDVPGSAGAPDADMLPAFEVPAALVSVQGGIVEVQQVHIAAVSQRERGERVGGGPRGRVAAFSSAARRRMLKMLARLRADVLPAFVTLTLPDGVPHDGEAAKLYLRRFRERLRRAYPSISFVWRMECKPRKSGGQVGEVVPHFHLLTYGVPNVQEFRSWLSAAWYGAVASGDEKHLRAGTQCVPARSGRQVKAYASKLYAAKSAPDDERLENAGRFYGVHNDEGLPWAELYLRPLTGSEAVQVLRIVRRYARAQMRRRGKHRRVRGWRWSFIDDAERWAALLAGDGLTSP